MSHILSSAAGRPIGKESIVNISSARAKALEAWTFEVTHNADLRARYIAAYGLPAWTRKRVERECEAVLLRLGVLQRWSVCKEGMKAQHKTQ
jgi:hypothetical protein